MLRSVFLAACIWLCVLIVAVAQEDLNPNVEAKTLGGKQFWSDELVFHEWRIQRNSLTGHYRLLDHRNIRRAYGSFADCQQRLDELKRELQLPPLSPRVVVLLHGITRSRGSMEGLAEYLTKHGCEVISVSYASTQDDIAAHAAALKSVLENLNGVEEVDFVAHSLGNLVIRHYMANLVDQMAAAPGTFPKPRVRRIVMLAPPNNGADLATRFKRNGLFRFVYGKSGQNIADLKENPLPSPRCEFGIIAGESPIRNPLLDGSSDFVVTVEETRLSGARDFVTVPAFHSTMKNDSRVREYTLRFLQEGHFVSEMDRQPIP